MAQTVFELIIADAQVTGWVKQMITIVELRMSRVPDRLGGARAGQ